MRYTLSAVGRHRSNGKTEWFFLTYDKQRWVRVAGCLRHYYNYQRAHQSLRYDELETPAEAFVRSFLTAEEPAELVVADGGKHGTKSS